MKLVPQNAHSRNCDYCTAVTEQSSLFWMVQLGPKPSNKVFTTGAGVTTEGGEGTTEARHSAAGFEDDKQEMQAAGKT